MINKVNLSCRCGMVVLEIKGPNIASVECLCNSCRKAGKVLQTLPGAELVLDIKDATHFVMHRKDRVRIKSGADQLKAYRLSPQAGTQRVIASCCNTPVFLDFKGGHWLSLYAKLWPVGERPAVELRTMTGDLDSTDNLPEDVPNLKMHSLSFYGRLLGAWVKMGFRSPKFVVDGEIEV